MADQFSAAERSEIMRRVRSGNTAPKLLVRKMVHELGFRFRLHSENLPGKPDLVLRTRKQMGVVYGCYWHQHSCDGAKRPATNRRYWNHKLDKNIERDKKNRYLLRRQGWHVLTV